MTKQLTQVDVPQWVKSMVNSDFEKYYREVVEIAITLGYSEQLINDVFYFDTLDNYENGMTVEDCINKEF